MIELHRALNGWHRGAAWINRRGKGDYPYGKTRTTETFSGPITMRCLDVPASYVHASVCRNYPEPHRHKNRIHHARVRWIATLETRTGALVLEHGQTYCGLRLNDPIYTDTPSRPCKHPASICPRCEIAFHPEGLAGVCANT